MKDSVSTSHTLESSGNSYRLAHLPALESQGFNISRLPFSMRILLENLLRREDGRVVGAEDIEAVATWDPRAEPSVEIAFMPGRVLLQDFTGVPAVVDLAAMRDAMHAMGGDPEKINPLQQHQQVPDESDGNQEQRVDDTCNVCSQGHLRVGEVGYREAGDQGKAHQDKTGANESSISSHDLSFRTDRDLEGRLRSGCLAAD